MNPLKIVPGFSALSHIAQNLGRGIREDGLLGAAKVVGRGLSKDWALGVAAMAIPGAQILGAATMASSGAEVIGALDTKADKARARAEAEAPKTGAGSW
jgi:hypothetical protein